MKVRRIAVVGGGAAGYFAAIKAAEENKVSEVVIFEASSRVLAKVLVSGGGRCNVTNNTLDPKLLVASYPRGKKELLGAFSRFKVQDTISWFEGRGVRLKHEDDARIFPTSDRSETIANCLIDSANKAGIKLILNSKVLKVVNISSDFPKFEVHFGDKIDIFDAVVIASGSASRGYEIAKTLGHKIIEPVPSLFTFEIENKLLSGLSGVSFKKARIKLNFENTKFENQGPMLITHWGLSGPAVIVLSSHAARELYKTNYKAKITVNFLNEKKEEEFYQELLDFKSKYGKKKLKTINPIDVSNSFWERVLEIVEAEETIWADISNKKLKEICRIFCNSELEITGKGKFKEEFVSCGGVDLKEVDFRKMESKFVPGVFFAGEVLDIDGVTGGFNFQAAWTTGWIAGLSA